MQLLGELIRLSSLDDLPLPWMQRTPLGLLNDTSVYVAIVKSEKRGVPEIVVSVLDPEKWGHVLTVECKAPDEPGVILGVLKIISKVGLSVNVKRLNIALSESVTVDAGDSHQITLVCEPADLPRAGDTPIKKKEDAIRKELRKAKLFSKVRVERLFDKVPNVIHSLAAQVENGWIRRVALREKIALAETRIPDEIDLDHVVVSADTDRRLLRYVFPRRMARALEIIHADEPDQYLRIMSVLNNQRLNVLSGLLRRGGVKYKRASYLAVCEPPLGKSWPRGWEDRVKEAIRKEILSAQVRVTSVKGAAAATSFRARDTIVVHIPEELLPRVRKLRESANKFHRKFQTRMKTNLKSQSNRVLRTLAKLSTELLRDNSSHIREVFGDHTEVLLSSVRQTQRAKAMDVQQKVNTLIDTLEESLVKPRRALDDGHVPNLRQQNVFRTIRKSLHHLIQIRHKITTNEGLRRAPMIPVFLSHRFVGDLYNRRIMKTVRDALLSFGAYPLRARPSGSLLGDYTIHQEVNARMWAAEAGIVIMTSTPGQRDNIGQNIPHELGFLLGQGKSVCILAEEGLSTWANLQGVYYPHFPSHDIAYQRTVRGSIHDLVGEFVASVRKNKQIRSLHP